MSNYAISMIQLLPITIASHRYSATALSINYSPAQSKRSFLST